MGALIGLLDQGRAGLLCYLRDYFPVVKETYVRTVCWIYIEECCVMGLCCSSGEWTV